MKPFIFLAAIALVVFSFDLVARLYHRKTGKVDSYFIELMRKGAHTSAGVMMAFAPQLGITTVTDFIIVIIGICIMVLNEKIFFFFKMRGGVIYTGLFCLLTVPLFYLGYFTIYQIGMLIYAIPDSLAALVGRAIGTPRVILNNKSIAGFVSFVASASIILFFANISLIIAIPIAVLLAVVELFSKKGSDNFLCPVIAIVFMYLLGIR